MCLPLLGFLLFAFLRVSLFSSWMLSSLNDISSRPGLDSLAPEVALILLLISGMLLLLSVLLLAKALFLQILTREGLRPMVRKIGKLYSIVLKPKFL